MARNRARARPPVRAASTGAISPRTTALRTVGEHPPAMLGRAQRRQVDPETLRRVFGVGTVRCFAGGVLSTFRPAR
jgi:hypothetical protein